MKKFLLSLGAAALAMSAAATNYNQGEAFAYAIDPSFSFSLAGDSEGYAQYPAAALEGQASLEYGFGMASAWFNGRQFATPADADEWCPVVNDPYGEGYVIRMMTDQWDGFGNFNFALPEVGEPCRIRVIYRVDNTAAENAWYADKAQKTFKVKLMDDADQDTYDYPQLEEYNEDFWNNPGWRVAEFVNNLAGENYYLSLLWDAAGLSCQRKVPFYVKEVSVVPVRLLSGYTAPADNMSLTITQSLPDLVYIGGNSNVGDYNYSQSEAFAYDIDPSFSFSLAGDTEGYAQYPAAALEGQASLEYGFGMASAWFNGRQFATPADADEWCPVVEDPYGEGYVVRMMTDQWDGFGNFNFALPEVGQLCRIRVIYRVDNTAAENAWYDGTQKPFKIMLMNNADQDDAVLQLTEQNIEYWNNPGWRVAEFVNNLAAENFYLSLLWDSAGLSCQRKVPFYVKEVSVVPVSLLSDYTVPADNASLTVVNELPELVKIDRGTNGVEDIAADNGAVILGGNGVVGVANYNGSVEVYDLLGRLVAKANVNGNASVAAPAGIVIVKAGNKVAKVAVL